MTALSIDSKMEKPVSLPKTACPASEDAEKRMRRKRYGTTFLAVMIAALLYIVFSAYLDQSADQKNGSPKQQRNQSDLMTITKLSFSRYLSGKRVIQLAADKIRISPKRFMIFSVRSFNEAIMESVRIDFFRYETNKRAKPTSEAGLVDSVNSLTGGKHGIITRAIINDLELRFYHQEALRYWLRAEKAQFNLRKRELWMAHVRIRDHDQNREIQARKAVWRERDNRLQIPGGLTVETPRGKSKYMAGSHPFPTLPALTLSD